MSDLVFLQGWIKLIPGTVALLPCKDGNASLSFYGDVVCKGSKNRTFAPVQYNTKQEEIICHGYGYG